MLLFQSKTCGGVYSEFLISVLQRNPPQIVLESGKYPGELVTVDKSGKMASDTRGGNVKLASRRFTVHVKVRCYTFILGSFSRFKS